MIDLSSTDDRYARLLDVERILIPHRQFTTVVERLQHALELSRHGADPRHTLLVGESGTGKTWIARYIRSVLPDSQIDGIRIKPILIVETPPSPTLKSLAQAILVAFGDPLAGLGNADVKRLRALSLIRQCQVQMLIVDELQHFLDHGSRNSPQSVADWLKSFVEDAQIPCLLMGLPRSTEILALNEQLRRRFSARLELLPFSVEHEQEELEFRTVLNALDEMLPCQRRSGLAEPDTARRIYMATNGLIGYVRRLTTGAFELMLSSGQTSIDRSLLQHAFVSEIWSGGQRELNPFDPKFSFRRLDRPGEPFSPTSHRGETRATRRPN
ncbi:TniB family NTP-binding protein [Burkholderia cenocepacia]|uniref:TniB family NTP-binding protein n=1 Tax=Burkholderia cenocepacia TaxID=95486 RepID=UPI0023B941A6|nr:TniB family NTP-binding protein [Burkholderia cenocepacia]MDF0499978.1 TniB family NTP-binding protein [Burkholderia cenocepacia]